MDTLTGQITCEESGIYYIFGKITFIKPRKPRYHVLVIVNDDLDNPVLQCTQGSFSNDSESSDDNEEEFVNCDFAGMITIEKESKISIMYSGKGRIENGVQMGPQIYTVPSATYFGIIKIAQ